MSSTLRVPEYFILICSRWEGLWIVTIWIVARPLYEGMNFERRRENRKRCHWFAKQTLQTILFMITMKNNNICFYLTLDNIVLLKKNLLQFCNYKKHWRETLSNILKIKSLIPGEGSLLISECLRDAPSRVRRASRNWSKVKAGSKQSISWRRPSSRCNWSHSWLRPSQSNLPVPPTSQLSNTASSCCSYGSVIFYNKWKVNQYQYIHILLINDMNVLIKSNTFISLRWNVFHHLYKY